MIKTCKCCERKFEAQRIYVEYCSASCMQLDTKYHHMRRQRKEIEDLKTRESASITIIVILTIVIVGLLFF